MANTKQGKLKDPVAEQKQDIESKKVEEQVEGLDLSGLKFETIPDSKARFTPPFEGYDYGPKVKVQTTDHRGQVINVSEVCTTFIVGVNPANEPPPDPSNLGHQVQRHKLKKVKVGDATFDVMKPDGEIKTVTLGTYHSRVLRCFEAPYSGDNYDIIFDRQIILDNGAKIRIAVIPQHSLRAQLVFYLNWKTDPPQPMVDKRYMLVDTRQVSRLRRIFTRIISQNLSQERMAAMVSGEVEATDEQLSNLPSEV